MLLLGLLAAICIVAVLISGLLGVVAGTLVDINAVGGAAIFVVGATVLATYGVANSRDGQES